MNENFQKKSEVYANDIYLTFLQPFFEMMPQCLTDFSSARLAAFHYFCPKGLWGGYAHFYTVCISGKTGDLFIQAFNKVCRGEREGYDVLRWLLTNPPSKRVSHLKGVAPQIVECVPSPEAQVALAHLRALVETDPGVVHNGEGI